MGIGRGEGGCSRKEEKAAKVETSPTRCHRPASRRGSMPRDWCGQPCGGHSWSLGPLAWAETMYMEKDTIRDRPHRARLFASSETVRETGTYRETSC